MTVMVKSNDRHITALTSLPLLLSATMGPVTLQKAFNPVASSNMVKKYIYIYKLYYIIYIRVAIVDFVQNSHFNGDKNHSCFDILENYFYLFLHLKLVQTRQ